MGSGLRGGGRALQAAQAGWEQPSPSPLPRPRGEATLVRAIRLELPTNERDRGDDLIEFHLSCLPPIS